MPAPLTNAEITTISARERQRMAHDLHDGLGQLLGGIALKLRSLHQTLAEAARPEAEEAADLVQLIKEAMGQTRLLAAGLDPGLQPAPGLSAALAKLAGDTQRLFRVPCHFHHTGGAENASAAVVEQFFRVAQESIHNAIRHGRATHIDLELSVEGAEAVLLIRDNGAGLVQRCDPKSGIGLRIMKHRAESLGGSTHLEDGPDGGTLVRCRAPLNAKQSA